MAFFTSLVWRRTTFGKLLPLQEAPGRPLRGPIWDHLPTWVPEGGFPYRVRDFRKEITVRLNSAGSSMKKR